MSSGLARTHLEHCSQGQRLLVTPSYLMLCPITCLGFQSMSQPTLTLSLVSHSELKWSAHHRLPALQCSKQAHHFLYPHTRDMLLLKTHKATSCPSAPSIKFQKMFTGTKLIKVVRSLWPELPHHFPVLRCLYPSVVHHVIT